MSDEQWFYTIDGEQKGPVPETQIKNMLDEGNVNEDTLFEILFRMLLSIFMLIFMLCSLPFLSVIWAVKWLKTKQQKKEILEKHVENSKYLSEYYKSSFFDRLKALRQNESFDEIIKICDQYLNNNNPPPLVKAELWNEIGFSYKLIDDNYKAIEMFTKTIEIDNEHLDACKGLAQTYLKLKDYNSAIEWLQKSKDNFERRVNELRILRIPHNRVKQLTDELKKIEIILDSLKSGELKIRDSHVSIHTTREDSQDLIITCEAKLEG